MHLLPLYFPRSESEENFAAYHLPYDVGNTDGEPVIQERQIRINAKPTLEALSEFIMKYIGLLQCPFKNI